MLPLALAGAYATEAIGIHVVFGAFLVGTVMPAARAAPPSSRWAATCGAPSPLLAPVYFVTSGMAVDIPGLRAGDLEAFVLIMVAACAGKFLGAFGGARAAGVGRQDSVALGVLMNTRGLIEIVLLTVGREAG